MEDLYREIIIEHYKNPTYRGHLDPNDIQFEDDSRVNLNVPASYSGKDLRLPACRHSLWPFGKLPPLSRYHHVSPYRLELGSR